MAHPILEQVQLYFHAANNNQIHMSDELIDQFGERCKDILRRQFQQKPEEEVERENNVIRMSAIGRPLCQLYHQYHDTPKDAPDEPFSKMKFIIGDLVEAVSMAVMEDAKLSIEAEQEEVNLDIADIHLKGTLDVIIDGKLYDIKSCSPYAFSNKFALAQGFEKLVEDDPFGYIVQGYTYAEAKGVPFGGWIAINKSTGEWTILEAPEGGGDIKDKSLKQAHGNIRHLLENKPFERCFEPIKETWYGKETGNTVLHRTCTYCPWRDTCWSDTSITYAPNPKSKAANPPHNYYIGEIK